MLARQRNANGTETPATAGIDDRRPAESDGGVEHGSSVPPVGFETVLVVAGAGLVLLVEFVYVEGNAGPGRLNTVFKTYAQIWMLFGVAAGAVGAWLADVGLSSAANIGDSGREKTGKRHFAGRALLAVIVVAASLYGVLALTDHFTSQSSVARVDDPTLDSLAFVSNIHPDEADAIAWLDNREGQPTIVSAPACYCNDEEGVSTYHWANAPSSLTGVPTVVGWDHELGYRDEADYFERVEDVRTIYQGTSQQRIRLLEKYDVRYIYVGPNERTAYGTVDFDGLSGVSVAKRWGAVTIYRVNKNKLSS